MEKNYERQEKTYSADFKAKAVLELLSNASTLNHVAKRNSGAKRGPIASKYGVTPQSLLTWKKQFLENASLAFVLALL